MRGGEPLLERRPAKPLRLLLLARRVECLDVGLLPRAVAAIIRQIEVVVIPGAIGTPLRPGELQRGECLCCPAGTREAGGRSRRLCAVCSGLPQGPARCKRRHRPAHPRCPAGPGARHLHARPVLPPLIASANARTNRLFRCATPASPRAGSMTGTKPS